MKDLTLTSNDEFDYTNSGARTVVELNDRKSVDNFLAKHEKVIIYFDQNNDFEKYRKFVAQSTSRIEFAVVDFHAIKQNNRYRSWSLSDFSLALLSKDSGNTSSYYGYDKGKVISRILNAGDSSSGIAIEKDSENGGEIENATVSETCSETVCEISGLEQLILEVEDPEILTKGKVLEIFDETQKQQVMDSHKKIIVHYSLGRKDELVEFDEKYEHFVAEHFTAEHSTAEHSTSEICFAVVHGSEGELSTMVWADLRQGRSSGMREKASSFFHGFIDGDSVSQTGHTFKIADLETLINDVKEPENMVPFKAQLGNISTKVYFEFEPYCQYLNLCKYLAVLVRSHR